MHVVVGLNAHGAEIMLKRLIKADPLAAADTIVVSLTSVGIVGKALRERNVPVHALEMSSGLGAPAALLKLMRLMQAHRPDIVQTWMYHADLLGGLAARLAGRRNVIWGIRRTQASADDRLLTTLVMKLCAWLSHWLPRKIVCNAGAALKAHIAAGYSASRMVVIHNGFDFDELGATSEQRSALRRQWNLSDEHKLVGTVGRFHPDKGQLNFVKGAAILGIVHPDVRFLMVGYGCDADNATLINWLAERGLKDRVVLAGERHDISVCLAAMDVFCMPSRTEGFPNCLAEAMAMSLPCVATDVGDAAILAEGTAMLVPPDDEQALAQGLMSVLGMSQEERRQMGRGAKQRVTTGFPIERTRQRFDDLYRQVIAEGVS